MISDPMGKVSTALWYLCKCQCRQCKINWLWCSPRSAFSVLQWETLPGGPSSSLDRCGDGCRIIARPRPRRDRRGDVRAGLLTNPRSAFYNWCRCSHRSCIPKITPYLIPLLKLGKGNDPLPISNACNHRCTHGELMCNPPSRITKWLTPSETGVKTPSFHRLHWNFWVFFLTRLGSVCSIR